MLILNSGILKSISSGLKTGIILQIISVQSIEGGIAV